MRSLLAIMEDLQTHAAPPPAAAEQPEWWFVLTKGKLAKVVPDTEFAAVRSLEAQGWDVRNDSMRSEDAGYAYAAEHFHAYPEAGAADAKTRPFEQSPEFRRWFGNSKVVDRFGRPLRVYHGTLHDFPSFEYSNSKVVGGAGWGFNRIGFWFDTHPDTPSHFASGSGSVLPCYLAIRNPLVLRGRAASEDDLATLERLRAAWLAVADKGDYRVARNAEAEYRTFRSNLESRIGEPFERLRTEVLPPYGQEPSMAAKSDYTRKVAECQQDLIAQGYDGIHLANTMADSGSRSRVQTDWWIAFHPNQIKSAIGNNGAYSDHPSINEARRARIRTGR